MTVSPELNPAELILRSLRGSTVTALDRAAEDAWRLDFEAAGLNIGCAWRLVSGKSIVLAGSDHGQKFGLPQPVDVCSEALRLISGTPVESVRIDEITADLSITFSGDMRLDLFNDSSGYEGWTFTDSSGLMLVAQGGGRIVIWKSKSS
jgi:hypothetical protein